MKERSAETDLNRLFHKLASGTEEDIEAFYGTLFNFCMGFMVNNVSDKGVHELEDLAQKAVLRIHKAIDGYQEKGAPFTSYAGTTCKNLKSNYFRDNARKAEEVDLDDYSYCLEAGPRIEDTIEQKQNRKRFLSGLCCLCGDLF